MTGAPVCLVFALTLQPHESSQLCCSNEQTAGSPMCVLPKFSRSCTPTKLQMPPIQMSAGNGVDVTAGSSARGTLFRVPLTSANPAPPARRPLLTCVQLRPELRCAWHSPALAPAACEQTRVTAALTPPAACWHYVHVSVTGCRAVSVLPAK